MRRTALALAAAALALPASAQGGTFRLSFKRNGERCKSPLVRWEAAPR